MITKWNLHVQRESTFEWQECKNMEVCLYHLAQLQKASGCLPLQIKRWDRFWSDPIVRIYEPFNRHPQDLFSAVFVFQRPLYEPFRFAPAWTDGSWGFLSVFCSEGQQSRKCSVLVPATNCSHSSLISDVPCLFSALSAATVRVCKVAQLAGKPEAALGGGKCCYRFPIYEYGTLGILLQRQLVQKSMAIRVSLSLLI